MKERVWSVVLFALLLFAPFASAQTGMATMGGQVKDATGAVVPGVAVSLQNRDTNVVHTTRSNHEGIYSISNLIPGTYTLIAKFSGFKDLIRDNVVLRVGDRIGLDVVLEVGAGAERVTITAEVPLLRTEDVQSGLVIDNRRIQELPQYNRDVLAFVFLTPNVLGSSQGDLRINGSRTGQIEYFVDGMPVTTGYDHSVPPSVPSREAVAEFKVLTNGLSAEYGRLSGGALVLVTRSGTNQFHGSGYEFFRNDKLNASDWNSNRFGRQKGVFHDNVFGGTIGGPVRVPKVYNGRDKTFFFLNYEGTRRRTGSNAVMTGVPTLLEREGDFSQTLIDQGVPAQIFDPLTSRQEGNRVRRDPFANNRIPVSRFDAMSKIYLPYYPAPNRPPLPRSSHDGNYIGSVASPSSNDRWTGRLDQNWSSQHVTHASVSRYDAQSSSPRWFSPMQPAGVNYSTAHVASLDHTWILSPGTLLNLRGGVVRSNTFSGTDVDVDASAWPLQREVVILLGTTRKRVPNLGTGENIFGLGGGSVSDTHDTIYNGSVSLQKVWNKHTIKFGYEHRRYYSNLTSGGSYSMTSDRRATAQYFDQATTGTPFATWLMGYANWGTGTQLAGPASLQPFHAAYLQDDIKLTSKLTINAGIRWDFEPARTERFDRQMVWDTNYKWDVTPNPGWNWDLVQKQAGISFPPPYWLNKGILGRAAMLGTKEYPSRTLQQVYPRHFGPRLGVAYQFLPRTVLRLSYGLNFLTMTGDTYLNSARNNVGYGDFVRMAQDGTPDGGLTYTNTFTVPMPGGQGYVPFTRDIAALNYSTFGIALSIPAYDAYPGYEHVVQLNLQRELGSGANTWVVEASYSANLGRDLPFYRGYHTVPDAYHVLGEPLGMSLYKQVSNPFYGQVPTNTSVGGKTIYLGRVLQVQPLWREIWAIDAPMAYSNYHAGYVQLEHRFGQGYGFLANYTLSKMLQAGGGIGAQGKDSVGSIGNSQGPPQASLGMDEIYGLAPFDVTHRLLFNYVADLPFGRGKRFFGAPGTVIAKTIDKFIGGWSMAGTTTLRGGTPFSLICASGSGRAWIDIGQGKLSRPRFVTPRVPYNNGVSGHTALEGSANFQPYLNPSAFRIPVNMEIGDVGSTLQGMRGPGFSQWDFALIKNLRLKGETSALQLRFEAQNVFNHMNAANPVNDIPNRAFGTITSQSGGSRVVMIAAKVSF